MAGKQGSPRIGSEAVGTRGIAKRSHGSNDRWGWLSAHVSYYDAGRQDDLLLDAVRPLFARLGTHGVRAYFLRHWRRGPHLQLNFRTTPEAFAALVRPALGEVVGGYLRDHPSTARLDPQRLLPMHRRLAENDLEPGPLLPWYPDNSIQDADYDPRLGVLGSQEAADLLAGFHLDTTDLAFRVTDRVRRREASRPGVCFDLMAATAHAMYDGGITRSFLSFRSHAEAFLCAWPEGPALRPAWDRYYAAQAGTLPGRVRAVAAALDGGGEPVREPAATIREWLDVLTATLARADALLAAGLSLGLRPPTNGPGDADMAGRNARLLTLSPFHRMLDSDPSWPQRRESPAFLRYRVALNLLYLTLTRLGVSPTERFLMCHCVANAVEDVYGVSAMDLVRAGSPDEGERTATAAGAPVRGTAAGGAR